MSNLTGAQKQKLFNLAVAFVLGVFAVFGFGFNVALQTKPAPVAPIVDVGSQSLSEQKFSNIRVDGTSHFIGAVSADGAISAGTQVSTAKVLIGAVTTINALTFGAVAGAAAADGGTIAHSMGVTPTVCLLSGSGSNALTRTLRVGSLDATNITLATSPGVTGTVQWACYR